MSSTSVLLDNIIEQTGGVGKFQIVLIAIVLGGKLPMAWSLLMMTFGGAVPNWWCESKNSTLASRNNGSNYLKVCNNESHICDSFSFVKEMNTVVSEWDLVCDKAWVVSVIETIQMGGLFTSGFISGHLADYIGRKPTYFVSFLFLTVFNAAAAFSVSWQMFAVLRFFIGFSAGFYQTVFLTFLAEFTPSRSHPFIMGIPEWPVWAGLYGLVSWWLHDWRCLHIATALVAFPWLFTWWFVPESFRWLVSHSKFDKAEKILKKIATMNGKPLPDITKLRNNAEKEWDEASHNLTYTIVDVFRYWTHAKHILLMSMTWLCCCYGYYAIAFGVQELSGNLYLNIFLLSIVEAPAQIITSFLNNCAGRKWTCIGFFLIAGVSGLVVGSIELTDVVLRERMINLFALIAKLGVASAWIAVKVMSVELYPTVIRNIGYGINNSVSRIGGMIAPQIVFISQRIPGVMYFVFAGTMLLSCVCSALSPETKNKMPTDRIKTKNKSRQKTLEDGISYIAKYSEHTKL